MRVFYVDKTLKESPYAELNVKLGEDTHVHTCGEWWGDIRLQYSFYI